MCFPYLSEYGFTLQAHPLTPPASQCHRPSRCFTVDIVLCQFCRCRPTLSSTASSAAQMLGENEDSYVQSYIRTQSIGIACAEKMEDSVEQLRAETIAMQGCQSTPVPRPYAM